MRVPRSRFYCLLQSDVFMRKPRVIFWKPWIAIAACALGVAGCSPEAQRHIRFPNFAHPGPAGAQRAEAIYHDPYPLNDVGPEVVGGRPLAYQQSLNEVDRARLTPPQAGVLRPVPIPGSTVTAPPATSSPFPVAPAQPAAPLATTPPPIVTSPVPAVAPAPPPAAFGTPVAPVVTTPAAPPANTNSFPPQQRAPY